MFSFLKHKNSCQQDAISIIKSVNFNAIKAAFNLYIKLKRKSEDFDKSDEKNILALNLPEQALVKLIEYKADFSRFSNEEKVFIKSLKYTYSKYDDVVKTLIDNHNNQELAGEVLKENPNLNKSIPKQYNNQLQLIEALIEMVREYQWKLEKFALKHHGSTSRALGQEVEDNQVYVALDT